MSADLARRVDHVHAIEPGRRTAMRYCADLAGLAFAIKERTAQTVVALVTQCGTGIPELLGVGLVSNIFNHALDLAVLDFVEKLPAELEVIALLVDRIRPRAN